MTFRGLSASAAARGYRSVPPTTVPAEFSIGSQDLADAVGVSVRQLQFWDERHVVKPVIVKHRREYGPTQCVEVAVVAALRHKGVSLQIIRRGLTTLRRDIALVHKAIKEDRDIYVMVKQNGRQPAVTDQSREIAEFALASDQPIVAVKITPQLRKLGIGRIP